MMSELTTADELTLESARNVYLGVDKTDEVTVNRWSKYGHDRLYIDGPAKFDKNSTYLDLQTGEAEDVPPGKDVETELEGDTLTIKVSNSRNGHTYTIVVHVEGEGFEPVEDNDDDDNEDDDGTDDSESDGQELVADGGRETDADLNDHIDDGTIEDAIAQHDDSDHPDALTVDDVREMLTVVGQSHREGWDITMDNLEDDDTRLVAETDDLLVLDTGDVETTIEDYELVTGDELDTIERRVLSQVIHALAGEHAPEHNWGVSYPLVMVKHDGVGDGQRYVEAVINSLCERGLSPGQAWAYYGVEIRGHSRNQWARRMGYDDHSTVSEAVRKAKQKLGA